MLLTAGPDAPGVSAVLALCAAQTHVDRQRGLERGGARSCVLRAAAWHHAEGDQGPARQGAEAKVVDLSADSGSPTLRPMRAGTGMSTVRRSRKRSTAWSRSMRDEDPDRAAGHQSGCYTTCAQLPLVPLLRAKAKLPDVVNAESTMTGAGGRGRSCLRSIGRLPRLRRRPPRGRARSGILARRRARGDRQLHARPRREPRDSLNHFSGRRNILHAILSKAYAHEPFVHILPSERCRRPQQARWATSPLSG